MRELLARTAVCTLGVSVAAWLLDGIRLGTSDDSFVTRLGTAVLVGLVLALLNMLVKPVLTLLSLPLLVLTLGLFSVVLGAVMLWLTSRLAGVWHLAFHVDNFWWQSVLGALVVGVMAAVTEPVLVPDREDRRARERRARAARRERAERRRRAD